jgi:asparagine synthetase A
MFQPGSGHLQSINAHKRKQKEKDHHHAIIRKATNTLYYTFHLSSILPHHITFYKSHEL